jgi:EAL domain-containing protein (putative c-di-GMP-specific phosphodiesterase class I)
MNELRKSRLLEEIIAQKDITIVFQPIFDIPNQLILGYEALSRGPLASDLHNPSELFVAAQRLGRLSDLELVCRERAISAFVEQKLLGKLFLNISPEVLMQPLHPKGETMQLLQLYGLSSKSVVIEITEQQRTDETLLKQAVNYYRQLGFTIAIDDLGAGHSGLRQWSELMPDIVKIDRYFVENCHKDVVKKAFLTFILSLAKATNTQVIAEGIEQEEELRLLAKLGVKFNQGFLLEKPQQKPSRYFPVTINQYLNSGKEIKCGKS